MGTACLDASATRRAAAACSVTALRAPRATPSAAVPADTLLYHRTAVAPVSTPPPGRGQPDPLRIPLADADIGELEVAYVSECRRSGWVSSAGPFVSRFEEAFAAACACRYAVAASNGTAALHLALLALGVGPGDEVLVPDLTFVSTANAVVYTGARPVLVDVDPHTWNLDPDDARRKVTQRTKAIVPVHLFGNPADLDAVAAIAAETGLAVVEDAAEALGASWRGRPVGSIGDVGCFSFFGNKLITTGEGGMVVTNRPEIADAARRWGNLSRAPGRPYFHDAVGYNYRMASRQAALGLAQLQRLDQLLAGKLRNAETYRRLLAGIPGLRWQHVTAGGASSWWMFAIVLEDAFGATREDVSEHLHRNGIDARPFFVPLHQLPPYAGSPPCPVAEEVSRRGLLLPSGTRLRAEQIHEIAETIARLGKDGGR